MTATTTEIMDTAVRASIVVDATAERAFEVFTADIGSWWPPEHHIIGEVAGMTFEPFVGGNVIDHGVNGTECRWARVLAYEPPARLVISWDLNVRFEIETDAAKTSEIEIRFVEEEPGRTRVTVEHRHLDRHGEGWEQMRAAVGAPDGWGLGLSRLAVGLAA